MALGIIQLKHKTTHRVTNMKKFGILLLLSMVILATACKKDKVIESGPTKEKLIVGDWNLESLSSDGIFMLDAYTTKTSKSQSKNEDIRLELNENSSFSMTGAMTLTVTTTTNNGVEVITENIIDSTLTGTWRIDGDYLVITEGASVSESKILELTSDKLKIESEQNDTIPTGVFGDLIIRKTTTSIYTK